MGSTAPGTSGPAPQQLLAWLAGPQQLPRAAVHDPQRRLPVPFFDDLGDIRHGPLLLALCARVRVSSCIVGTARRATWPCFGRSIPRTGSPAVRGAIRVDRVAQVRALPLAEDQLVGPELLEVVGERRAGNAELLLDLGDDQPVRMGRQEQPHDAEAGLGTHRRKHVGQPRDVDGAILNIHTSTNIKYSVLVKRICGRVFNAWRSGVRSRWGGRRERAVPAERGHGPQT